MAGEPWSSSFARWFASFMRRYFWLVLGAGLLPLGVIAVVASPDPISFAMVGVAVFFLVKGARQFWLDSRLRRAGTLGQATITGVVQSDLRINFQFQQVITYRYTDHLGHTHEGKSGYLAPDEAADWKVGDTGMVRYDHDRPAESVWLGRG